MKAYRALTSLAATVNQLPPPLEPGLGTVLAAELPSHLSGLKGPGASGGARQWQHGPGPGWYFPPSLVLGRCVAAWACLGKCLKPLRLRQRSSFHGLQGILRSRLLAIPPPPLLVLHLCPVGLCPFCS